MIPSPGCQGGVASMRQAYVYLLRSKRTNHWYLGWTTDLQRRLEEHAAGLSRYTHARGPWQLVAYETCENAEEAKRLERMLKRNPRMLAQFKKRAVNVFRLTTFSGRPPWAVIHRPMVGGHSFQGCPRKGGGTSQVMG